MLNFRTITIAWVLSLAGLWLVRDGLGGFAWPALAVSWLYFTVLVLGCIFISWNFWFPSVCSGPADAKRIAISFDDGPAPGTTEKILDTLAAEQVQAAFFCIGRNITGHEALLRRIDAEGHVVGNHSDSHHFWFDLFPAKKMLEDLQRMDDRCHLAIGKRPRLFRPPYGVTNPNLARAVKAGGYRSMGWNVRSLDTVAKDGDALLGKLEARIKPGALFLFHDTVALTAEVLPRFIRSAKAKGYVFVRPDRLTSTEAYA